MKNATIEPTEKNKNSKITNRKTNQGKTQKYIALLHRQWLFALGVAISSATDIECTSTNVKPTPANVKPTATNNKPIAAGQTNGLLQFPLSVGRRRSKIG